MRSSSDWGIPRVKIKIGESWGAAPLRDLARIAFARQVIGPDAELYVDANGGYTRKQAIRMAHAMAGHDVTWFEEPVSSDDLDGLREVRDQVDPDVTAGEYGYDLAYFARMVDAQAVDCLQATSPGAAASPNSCAPPSPPPAACRSSATARRTCTPMSPPRCRTCATSSTSTITSGSSRCCSTARWTPAAVRCGRIRPGRASA